MQSCHMANDENNVYVDEMWLRHMPQHAMRHEYVMWHEYSIGKLSVHQRFTTLIFAINCSVDLIFGVAYDE